MDTGLRVFRLCLLWGDVADGGVDTPPIVIAFDIGEQVAPRGIAIGVFAVVDQLGFQSAKETFHWRIVPAVCLAAHRLGDGGRLQNVAILAGGVLAAAIGMMDEARPWTPPLDCHDERGDGEPPPNWWTLLLSSEGSGKVSNGPG